MFENRVLKKIFVYKGKEVARGWETLHNEELHNLYASPYIIRVIKSRRLRWTGHVAGMAEIGNAFRILVGKPEGERLRGRPRRKWKDNIGMYLRERG
jgi:hypothetical protein